tara:strand:+ start:3239 stop:3655 length:417 start_codon:yes stop_codon:yes gene_type:complete
MDSQLEFMRDTIYGDTELQEVIGEGNTKRLRKVFEEGSPERVAKEFQDIWERPGTPHEERRIESARRFKEIYVEPEQEFNLLYTPDYQQPQPMSVPRRRPSLASDLVGAGTNPTATQDAPDNYIPGFLEAMNRALGLK